MLSGTSGGGDDVFFAFIPAMEREYITDWHSALFYKELIVWKQLVAAAVGCFSEPAPACELLPAECVNVLSALSPAIARIVHNPQSTVAAGAYVLVAIIAYTLIAGCLLYVARRMRVRNRWTGTLLLLSWGGGCVMFSCCFSNGSLLGVDYMFLACSAVLLWLCMDVRKRCTFVKCVWAMFFVIVSVHLCEFRKNALILLPFICLVFSTCSFPGFTKLKRVGVSFLLFLLVVSVVKILIPMKLVPQRSHSAYVMVVSDIKMASILTGKYGEEKSLIEEKTGLIYQHRTAGLLRAEAGCSSVDDARLMDCINHVRIDEEQWQVLKDIYTRYWTEYPREMLVIRMLSAYHLFFSVDTPEQLARFLRKLYPHVKNEQFMLPRGYLWEDVKNLSQRILLWGGAFFCCVLLWRRCRRCGYAALDRGILLLYAFALLYAASFLIVTPAPMYRYLAPVRFVLLLLIPVSLLRPWILTSPGDNEDSTG